jgi:hypothetical protein
VNRCNLLDLYRVTQFALNITIFENVYSRWFCMNLCKRIHGKKTIKDFHFRRKKE